MAAACDHVDHVNTQLPYALVQAGLAALAFVGAGLLIG
jgi:Na+/H+ antiporter NhaC